MVIVVFGGFNVFALKSHRNHSAIAAESLRSLCVSDAQSPRNRIVIIVKSLLNRRTIDVLSLSIAIKSLRNRRTSAIVAELPRICNRCGISSKALRDHSIITVYRYAFADCGIAANRFPIAFYLLRNRCGIAAHSQSLRNRFESAMQSLCLAALSLRNHIESVAQSFYNRCVSLRIR
jgi:hypothetical protein